MDHAGVSVQPVLLRALTSFLPANLLASANNSLLTVITRFGFEFPFIFELQFMK